MEKLEILAAQIEDLKVNLESLVAEETELINPEIVRVSEALDKILIKYYRLMSQEKKAAGG